MIALEAVSALLLCAGQSRRFGSGDKLLAPLRGAALVEHPARLVASLPFRERIAVVPPGQATLRRLLESHDFRLVENPNPEAGKDGSLRIGLAAALASGPQAVMVLLGDMPNITTGHLAALGAAATAARAAISRSGGTASPPTLIPAAIARAALEQPLRPVRETLEPIQAVEAEAGILADCDDPADLAREGLRAIP